MSCHLAGHRDGDDGPPEPARAFEVSPAGVEPALGPLGPRANVRRGQLSSTLELARGPDGAALMPGGLHQQAAGVAVSGLGDACAGVTLARLVLDRDEPEVGADRAPRKAVPITDLDRQPEGGEGTHPAKTAKPRHDLGPARLGREPLDLGIEGIATRERGMNSTIGSGQRSMIMGCLILSPI